MNAEQLPEKLNRKEVLATWGKKTESIERKEREDFDELLTAANQVSAHAAESYDAFYWDHPNAVKVENEVIINHQGAIGHAKCKQATVWATKEMVKSKDGSREQEYVTFQVYDKPYPPEGMDIQDIEAPVGPELLGQQISDFSLAKKDNIFEMNHRYTYPEHRGTGLGIILTHAAEEFAQKYANRHQKTIKIDAFVGSVDVLCHLWNRGFRPDTREGYERVEKVIRGGDGDLKMALGTYVFPRDTVLADTDDPSNNSEDRYRAYPLYLVKEFEPKLGEEAVAIREQITKEVQGQQPNH